MKIDKHDMLFVVGASLVYCSLSAGFSLVSTVLPGKMILINPIDHGSLNLKEIGGHFVWGAIAGIVTLKWRYIFLGGLLAVLIDSDHLVGLLHVEGIPRMSHSITFAVLATIILLLVFSRKDYILAAIAGTSVLTHISYDIFDGGYGFPVFTPFVNNIIELPKIDWLIFEILAICIVGIVSFITPRMKYEKTVKED